jgi:hypothetical protein
MSNQPEKPVKGEGGFLPLKRDLEALTLATRPAMSTTYAKGEKLRALISSVSLRLSVVC